SRDNQISIGTNQNTYTMSGITSNASKAAQQGPVQIVTSDQNGNLATADAGSLLGGATQGFQNQINALTRRDQELAEGIAIAMAVQQPIFHDGQTFAMNFGYGNFGGTDALGFSAGGIVNKGAFGAGSTVTVHGGLGWGTDNRTVAGRAGVSIGW